MDVTCPEHEWGSAFFVSDYKRLIAYIYEYDGAVRLGNKGFARIDIRNGNGKIFVNIKDTTSRPSSADMYFYRWQGKIMQSYKIGELTMLGGEARLKTMFSPDKIADGVNFDDISGLIIGQENDRLYGAEWDDRDINMKLLDINGAVQAVEAAECGTEDIVQEENNAEMNQCADIADMREGKEGLVRAGDWREIFINNRNVQPFDDDIMYDCVQTGPELMMQAPFCERGMYRNSFLLHGYFTYGHILVGKIKRPGEGERYFVGVPGIYQNRERSMAGMYGFDNFRKSCRKDFKHPYFGYWYRVFDWDCM